MKANITENRKKTQKGTTRYSEPPDKQTLHLLWSSLAKKLNLKLMNLQTSAAQ